MPKKNCVSTKHLGDSLLHVLNDFVYMLKKTLLCCMLIFTEIDSSLRP